MWLMNKIGNTLIKEDNISEIYVPQNRNVITLKFKNGNGCQLGIYNTEEEARVALEILTEKVEGYVLKAPIEQEIKAKISNTTVKKKYDRTAIGQKLKRHGGS